MEAPINAHIAFGTEICCLRTSRMKKFYVEFLWRHFNFNQLESFFADFSLFKKFKKKCVEKLFRKKIFFFSEQNIWKCVKNWPHNTSFGE